MKEYNPIPVAKIKSRRRWLPTESSGVDRN